MTEFPPIDGPLLAALEAVFPNRSPEITDTDRQVWRKVGNVEVVAFLRARFDAQNDAAPEADSSVMRLS